MNICVRNFCFDEASISKKYYYLITRLRNTRLIFNLAQIQFEKAQTYRWPITRWRRPLAIQKRILSCQWDGPTSHYVAGYLARDSIDDKWATRRRKSLWLR